MKVLSVSGITAGYGSVPIVQKVSLDAAAGEVVAVVGPNGAGKSTFLKAVFGLLKPSEGSVHVADRDLTGLEPNQIARLGMAYVPQVENVFPSLSVRENLEMGAYIRNDDVQAKIDDVFGIFPDLKSAARRQATTLSGGQRNMLALGRALMLDPQVLLLDEPTAGLAPAYTYAVWDLVKKISARGTAVVVVEQNVDLALQSADRAYVLVAGRNRLEGTPEELSRANLSAIFLGQEREVRAEDNATRGG